MSYNISLFNINIILLFAIIYYIYTNLLIVNDIFLQFKWYFKTTAIKIFRIKS
jgi:hypothetical protein